MKKAVLTLAFAASALAANAFGLSGGVEFECMSAYVFNGMVYNDEPVASVCPWLEFYLTKDFWLYGNIWQLYDLTDRRREEGVRGEWNETDFEVGVGGHLWKSEDEAYRLTGTLGWYWDTEIIDEKWTNAINYPMLNLEFANPCLTPFLFIAYDHVNTHSMLMMPGVKRDFELLEKLSLEAKVYAVGGHKRLMQKTFMSENAKTGIGSLTGRLTLKWNVAEFLDLSCYCAMTANVNRQIHNDWSDSGEDLPDYYSHEEFVYGGINAGFSF